MTDTPGVTEEMIEAGRKALNEWGASRVVRTSVPYKAIYLAMKAKDKRILEDLEVAKDKGKEIILEQIGR